MYIGYGRQHSLSMGRMIPYPALLRKGYPRRKPLGRVDIYLNQIMAAAMNAKPLKWIALLS